MTEQHWRHNSPLEPSPPAPASIGRIIVDFLAGIGTIAFMIAAFRLAHALHDLHAVLVSP